MAKARRVKAPDPFAAEIELRRFLKRQEPILMKDPRKMNLGEIIEALRDCAAALQGLTDR